MWRFGPFTRYSWGWDLKLPFGWWLTYSSGELQSRLYISTDATPPHKGNRGVMLLNRLR